MKISRLTLAVAAILGTGAASTAYAIDLYVDSKTKQIYAEPGPGRMLMGSFEQVQPNTNGYSKHDAHHSGTDQTSDRADIDAIKHEMELEKNEIKALEEHVVAQREERAKNDEKWFNKINVRGYTQLRYNQPLTGDRVAEAGEVPELRSPGDGGIKNNSSFSFRRVRLVFSGDVNDYVSLYLQPDFASSVDSSIDNGNFAQLRDAYADLAFDKKHEYRIRAGQSKVPFGWENLQSSQNRLALDRNDALNSAVPSERDLGLFAYWSPEHVQKLWKDLSKKGLKTSGDYGILGLGIYNGQGINRNETNDDLYVVAHSSYPIDLGSFIGYPFTGQVLEVGADYMNGNFDVPTADTRVFGTDRQLRKDGDDCDGVDNCAEIDNPGGFREERYAVHAVLFPQPFGVQAEWNWGRAATLNPDTASLQRENLQGGYVQAMYKIDKVFRDDGTLIPYVKWQTYRGAYKAAANSPRVSVDELEVGVEYQIMKALELTLAYSTMDRTNVRSSTSSSSSFLGQASGDMLRAQVQWNY
ncbi:porin [Methyloglobulus sp.]|uniref:porin n=1 Tax=Methyloglobulus sp. TaxID=2518622 RepID=UPI0032B8761A